METSFEPPRGIMYGRRPCLVRVAARCSILSSTPSLPTWYIRAPAAADKQTFPESKLISLPNSVSNKWHSSPNLAHEMAVERQWLLVAMPHEIIVSAPRASASAIKNSNFRTLLPVREAPVWSSRLMKSSILGLADLKVPKFQGSIGVGKDASFFMDKSVLRYHLMILGAYLVLQA